MTGEENSKLKQDVINDQQDDLVTLGRIFSIPDLNYIDINLRERLAEISERWPLLHELTLSKLAGLRSAEPTQRQEAEK